jgi:hypothetical protein
VIYSYDVEGPYEVLSALLAMETCEADRLNERLFLEDIVTTDGRVG